MNIFHLFKRKNEFEEYMEDLRQDKRLELPIRPPWMSMPKDQFKKAHKEYLKAMGE